MKVTDPLLCAGCGEEIDPTPGVTYRGSTDGRVWHNGCAPSTRAADTETDEDAEWLKAKAAAIVYGGIMLEAGARAEYRCRLERIASRLKPDTEAEGLRERLREAIDALEIALGPWQGAVKANGEKFIQETRTILSDKRGPK